MTGDGKFKIKQITKLSDVTESTVLPESDLCFQDQGSIYQFAFERKHKDKKVKVTPGYYVLAAENRGLVLKDTEFRKRNLLTSVVNTQTIFNEARTFFSNLDIYDILEEPKARKILIYSQPGMGKTVTITQYCHMAVEEDPGTTIIVWPTSQIDSDEVLDFLERKVEYSKKCTRLILIMEDIGGGERENRGESRGVDSALLDLLDGLRITFKLPTFMIATTNYPQNLLSALADRPGRFDMMLELDPPSSAERIQLMEFIAKRSLSNEEKEALASKEVEDFSIAHLKEIVVRGMLHRKTIPEVIQELLAHKKRFKNSFEKNKKDGWGFER